MTILLLFSLCLNLIIVFILLRSHLLSDRSIKSDANDIRDTIDQIKDPAVKSERLLSYLEHRDKSLKWYERGISTIGVFAFISMAIATGFQTVNTAHNNDELAHQRDIIERNNEILKKSERVVKEECEYINNEYYSRGYVSESQKNILRLRLEMLQTGDQNSSNTLETYNICLALDDIDRAAECLYSHRELLAKTKCVDKVVLAEAFYFLGNIDECRKIHQSIGNGILPLNLMYRYRYLIIEFLISDTPEEKDAIVRDVAALMKIPFNEAKIRTIRMANIFSSTSDLGKRNMFLTNETKNE